MACQSVFHSLAQEILDDAKFTQANLPGDAFEVTSIFEIADTIVDDLKASYGIEYTIAGDTYLLNKEIFEFLTSPKKEQLEIWEGKRTHHKNAPFIFFMDLLKKLKAIKQKELDKPDILDEEKKILNSAHHGDFFLVWIFHIKPVAKLVKQNRALFAKMNLTTRKSIDAQIFKTQEKIADKWKSGQSFVSREELLRRLRTKRSARK